MVQGVTCIYMVVLSSNSNRGSALHFLVAFCADDNGDIDRRCLRREGFILKTSSHIRFCKGLKCNIRK